MILRHLDRNRCTSQEKCQDISRQREEKKVVSVNRYFSCLAGQIIMAVQETGEN